mgnify:CR=1 FL=1
MTKVMKEKFKVVIFTDLDGSLLHRDTFKFDTIKDYISNLVDQGIIIIPNSSKTEKEIEKFNEELGVKLPYISENGSSIQNLDLINNNFPNKIILSREKEELLKIFINKVPEQLRDKCVQISKMNKKEQEKIFGQKDDNLKNALNRKYTLPFLFIGNKNEKNRLLKILCDSSFPLLRIILFGKFVFSRSKPCMTDPFSAIKGKSEPSSLLNLSISFSVLLEFGIIIIP